MFNSTYLNVSQIHMLSDYLFPCDSITPQGFGAANLIKKTPTGIVYGQSKNNSFEINEGDEFVVEDYNIVYKGISLILHGYSIFLMDLFSNPGPNIGNLVEIEDGTRYWVVAFESGKNTDQVYLSKNRDNRAYTPFAVVALSTTPPEKLVTWVGPYEKKNLKVVVEPYMYESKTH